MRLLGFDNKRLLEICRSNDISMLGLFGSYARGEAGAGSDVDLLVRFSKRKSLVDLIRLEREISLALGIKVDLVTEGSLSPYLKKDVQKDLRVIYES